jgi:hypothetical protein
MIRKPGGGVQKLAAAIRGLDGVRGKVGYFETAKYPDGTPVAYVASIQEFGSAEQNIPPRPTMRTTIAEQSPEWTKQFGKGAKAVAAGTVTAPQVMGAVGMLAAADVAKAVSALTSPPLKQSTIDARRRRYADKKTVGNLSKPLVDTAVMVNSITHIVEESGQ